MEITQETSNYIKLEPALKPSQLLLYFRVMGTFTFIILFLFFGLPFGFVLFILLIEYLGISLGVLILLMILIITILIIYLALKPIKLTIDNACTFDKTAKQMKIVKSRISLFESRPKRFKWNLDQVKEIDSVSGGSELRQGSYKLQIKLASGENLYFGSFDSITEGNKMATYLREFLNLEQTSGGDLDQTI